MKAKLRYGKSGLLTVDVPDDQLVADWSTPAVAPIENLADTVQQALANPVDYPPLAQAILPTDHVTITFEESVERVAEVVAGVIMALLEGGVAPEAITVLHTPAAQNSLQGLCELLPLAAAEKVDLRVHDASEPNDQAFLGATKNGDSIYVNRALTDADLVIPIGRASLAAANQHSCFDHLYPAFAGAETIPTNPSDRVITAEVPSRQVVGEVGWMLGIRLIVQVVPAGAAGIANVLVGDLDAIQPLARAACESAWKLTAPSRVSLAIISVGGEQSWENLGQALTAVEPIVSVEESAVLLCTELDALPAPMFQVLADLDNLDRLEEELAAQNEATATTVLQFARALRRGSVYLLSQLDDDLIEDLGLAPVHSEKEVSRLASRYESCILLANAQFAQLAVTSADHADADRSEYAQ